MASLPCLSVQLKKGMEVTAELYVKYDVPKKVRASATAQGPAGTGLRTTHVDTRP